MMIARVAAEPQNFREAEAEADALARIQASVVSAARKMEYDGATACFWDV
jgi:hypothetical protein